MKYLGATCKYEFLWMYHVRDFESKWVNIELFIYLTELFIRISYRTDMCTFVRFISRLFEQVNQIKYHGYQNNLFYEDSNSDDRFNCVDSLSVYVSIIFVLTSRVFLNVYFLHHFSVLNRPDVALWKLLLRMRLERWFVCYIAI